ncbi:MAG: CsbD family protein [Burkholderiaceae bacterium]
MNKDRVNGRVNQATGKVTEEAAKAMDDTSLTIKGKAGKAGGKTQAILGDVKNDMKTSSR